MTIKHYTVTVILTRTSGHDITTSALLEAQSDGDIAGLDIDSMPYVFPCDISESEVKQAARRGISATYDVTVETDDADEDAVFEAIDGALIFNPTEGWDVVRSTVALS